LFNLTDSVLFPGIETGNADLYTKLSTGIVNKKFSNNRTLTRNLISY